MNTPATALMMKYDLLKTLLPYLEAYERSYPMVHNPQHFAVWLARQTTESEQVVNGENAGSAPNTPDAGIGTLLIYLNRYLKGYSRKALENSPLGGMDEFVYLATLLEFGALTKSDLIQRNRHEKPTGMEIIRRLMALGFVTQSNDPDDRRSKRLAVTTEGIAVFKQVAGRMQQVMELTAGNLSSAEKLLLLQILEKLENFHQVILAKTRGADFDVIVATGDAA